ncbi:uncharacterized protein LOC119359425 [Triticum dicoccoides]|uniref:uncharacterized protein LOC119359425 n=1 Tax=Triticum dicoccoides TaxID=85692 RepID=UPI00188FFC59|nr:uncharacterized protein LOC119359425 [Triticum dicoccoides]
MEPLDAALCSTVAKTVGHRIRRWSDLPQPDSLCLSASSPSCRCRVRHPRLRAAASVVPLDCCLKSLEHRRPELASWRRHHRLLHRISFTPPPSRRICPFRTVPARRRVEPMPPPLLFFFSEMQQRCIERLTTTHVGHELGSRSGPTCLLPTDLGLAHGEGTPCPSFFPSCWARLPVWACIVFLGCVNFCNIPV